MSRLDGRRRRRRRPDGAQRWRRDGELLHRHGHRRVPDRGEQAWLGRRFRHGGGELLGRGGERRCHVRAGRRAHHGAAAGPHVGNRHLRWLGRSGRRWRRRCGGSAVALRHQFAVSGARLPRRGSGAPARRLRLGRQRSHRGVHPRPAERHPLGHGRQRRPGLRQRRELRQGVPQPPVRHGLPEHRLHRLRTGERPRLRHRRRRFHAHERRQRQRRRLPQRRQRLGSHRSVQLADRHDALQRDLRRPGACDRQPAGEPQPRPRGAVLGAARQRERAFAGTALRSRGRRFLCRSAGRAQPGARGGRLDDGHRAGYDLRRGVGGVAAWHDGGDLLERCGRMHHNERQRADGRAGGQYRGNRRGQLFDRHGDGRLRAQGRLGLRRYRRQRHRQLLGHEPQRRQRRLGQQPARGCDLREPAHAHRIRGIRHLLHLGRSGCGRRQLGRQGGGRGRRRLGLRRPVPVAGAEVRRLGRGRADRPAAERAAHLRHRRGGEQDLPQGLPDTGVPSAGGQRRRGHRLHLLGQWAAGGPQLRRPELRGAHGVRHADRQHHRPGHGDDIRPRWRHQPRR